ncbi:tripartite tricarboxylate transporter TctB family protein [Halomonas dongshanensis]|uniref:Tripartite tricarboxylate transporter TctB family protein n=1 Tax=Halomonas dongshanensis TaxID=2890835 RepID=A0ABT2EDW8_9GAMM|nr:tripartite tricarboxylate transporter TctB family protein [Halomonas dongshanensis]MCS2609779.1 tripartite tricarboxylate transporter TctB family protein [Halomonas dongshanensis]
MTNIDNERDERDASTSQSSSITSPSRGESGETSLKAMTPPLWSHPDLVAGVLIIVASALLLTRTSSMPFMTALLPVTMLGALIVLAALMVLRALVGGKGNRKLAPRFPVFSDAKAFWCIILAISLYMAGVATIGFYTSTAIMLPVVAWLFGYRDLKRLLLADIIFTGGLAVVFVVLMGQELPAEFFVR